MTHIIKKLVLIQLIITTLILSLSINKNLKTSFAENYSSEIIMEVKSKRVLHEKNAYSKKFMASTTKILTALVIIENCKLNEIIVIPKEAVGIEGSSIYLEEGEKLSIKDLLYGLMLRSGNDCATALALHCSNSIDNFALLMNKTAKRIGANNSNFTNPHGLHNENHFTTAYDLALISSYAIKNPVFKEIVSTKSVKIPFTTKNQNRLLKNKNKMLFQFDGATGIKTGFTKKAGRCLVTSCERNGMELVCVVLNCPPMFEQSKTLLSKAFNNYNQKLILESDYILGFTNFNDKKIPLYVKNDVILPLSKSEEELIEIVYEYPKNLEFPPKKDNEIGLVKFFLEKKLLFIEKIYTI